MLADLISALSRVDEETARAEVKALLEKGVAPFDIIEKGIMAGMDQVGQKFERGDYFLPELLLAARAVESCTDLIKPFITADQCRSKGVIVIGTVAGDIHDLGKNLIARTLESAGFQVIDLGVDVPVDKFAEAVRREKADMVAMSALLTVTMIQMEQVIKALRADPASERIKVLVGGPPLDDIYASKRGADAYGKGIVDALKKAQELIA